MKPASRLTVPVPSSSLLRFLHFQSEQVCYFTPSSSPQSYQYQRTKVPPHNTTHTLPAASRKLTTTSCRQATVESTLFNLDFLRPPSQQTPSRLPVLTTKNSPGPLSPSSNHSDILRHASTDTRPLLKRFWKQRQRQEKANPNLGEKPPLPSFLEDSRGTSLGRRKTGKGGNELKLRCTEFDENGNVTLMDGEFKKSELIAKVYTSLLFRELESC